MCPSDNTTPNATAPQRRDGDRGEKGLTTLEWLLVVAAIAGLAALAVVLVQNVVNETAENVQSQEARLTAADIATTEIHQDWQNEHPKSPEHADEINRKYRTRCQRFGIIYADISLDIESKNGDYDTRKAGGLISRNAPQHNALRGKSSEPNSVRQIPRRME